jgi:hypothetical protein
MPHVTLESAKKDKNAVNEGRIGSFRCLEDASEIFEEILQIY